MMERARLYTTSSQATVEKKMQEDGLLHAGLCLFAPALFGALICGWKGVLLKTPVFGNIMRCFFNKFPAYQQLQSDSPVLQQIRSETVDLATKFPELTAFRARNIFSRHDEVASICPLPTDFPSEYESGKDHTSICKPSTSYLRPLTFVRDVKYAKA